MSRSRARGPAASRQNSANRSQCPGISDDSAKLRSPAATSAPNRARAATARRLPATGPSTSPAATSNAATGCAPIRSSPTNTSNALCNADASTALARREVDRRRRRSSVPRRMAAATAAVIGSITPTAVTSASRTTAAGSRRTGAFTPAIRCRDGATTIANANVRLATVTPRSARPASCSIRLHRCVTRDPHARPSPPEPDRPHPASAPRSR